MSTRAPRPGRDVLGDSVVVEELSVDPSHQRAGVATALLPAVEEWLPLRPNLPRTISLGVETDNLAAIGLYAKLGYVVARRSDEPIVFAGGNGRPCHIMFKRPADGEPS